ncbi:MAG: stage 0 sporulation family protein [Oscillospiraceae bacterium]|nr:stage 0 sporulation family protein [Oscillospiraceae bacterium]
MTKIVGVCFKSGGKVYSFAPGALAIQKGDYVIVETARGTECGEVIHGIHEVPDSGIVAPLKTVVRLADSVDIRRMQQNREDERNAFDVCTARIEKHKLDMKLVDVEFTLDRSKILFYFTADGRIDFRELVKDLAGVFHARIELRQIGVRDESKMLGGLGICGQPFCCSRFLNNFQPVSIKMAKEQGLSLNPAKISGSCGRLMCCLAYEQPAYEYLNRITPGLGSIVKTPDGTGSVIEVNLISGTLRVRLEAAMDTPAKLYPRTACTYLRGGKRAPVMPDPEPEDSLPE